MIKIPLLFQTLSKFFFFFFKSAFLDLFCLTAIQCVTLSKNNLTLFITLSFCSYHLFCTSPKYQYNFLAHRNVAIPSSQLSFSCCFLLFTALSYSVLENLKFHYFFWLFHVPVLPLMWCISVSELNSWLEMIQSPVQKTWPFPSKQRSKHLHYN